MIYFSQLLNQRVWDGFGREIGILGDILIDGTDKKLPFLAAVELKKNRTELKLIPANQIASLWPSITLITGIEKIEPYIPSGHELPLLDRVLDQQIVDTEGKRLVRVNDLQLARAGHQFVLTGVDVSGMGLLRRLGIEKFGQMLEKFTPRKHNAAVIPWEFVASIEHDDPLRLSVSQNKLVKMPPADIAAILDELDRHTSTALLAGFDDHSLADTLEESSTELQKTILSTLEPERAADILEEMDPDEAADVLADLPDQTSDSLLALMAQEEASEIRTLLAYPEDSAGGMMTTEFTQVPIHLSVQEALQYLRHSEDAQEDEVMYYLYVIDQEQRLAGMITLRDLVMADPNIRLSDWEYPELISVPPTASQEEVAYLIAKYNLLSVPVVEPETGLILGIVTADDAIDTVLPTEWKKRLPRLF